MQSTKGEGLGALFGGGSMESLFGSRAGTFLSKLTTVLAILFFITSLSLTIVRPRRQASSVMQKMMQEEAVQVPKSAVEVPSEEEVPMPESGEVPEPSNEGSLPMSPQEE